MVRLPYCRKVTSVVPIRYSWLVKGKVWYMRTSALSCPGGYAPGYRLNLRDMGPGAFTNCGVLRVWV